MSGKGREEGGRGSEKEKCYISFLSSLSLLYFVIHIDFMKRLMTSYNLLF